MPRAPANPQNILGYHATFAYAYDSNGLWIENSWGTGWGKGGYAKLSWKSVGIYGIEATSLTPLNAPPPWQHLPGAATDISVGADGSVWVIGTDHIVYYWTGKWQSASCSGEAIAVGPGGNAWIVGGSGLIFEHVGRHDL